MTEQEKFLAWHEQEVANGLVDIKFCTADLSKITSSSFYSEANQMNCAEGISSDKYNDNVARIKTNDLVVNN